MCLLSIAVFLTTLREYQSINLYFFVFHQVKQIIDRMRSDLGIIFPN